MNKLEQYLDQVCHSIGGPWEMREHVRQEMREHLLDAVAQHKATGMTEEQALDQALAEFGKPDEVRSDLESTHGKRTTWIIDKALEWKEKTMRAKWLWATWAYVGLALVILLEVLFITFNVIFIVPKFQKLMRDGLIDSADLDHHGVSWMVNFLYDVSYVGGNHTLLLIAVPALAWGLFEWRVRSDNKPFMRLAALGTAAVALTFAVMLTTASMLVPFCLAMPALSAMSSPWAIERVADIHANFMLLEEAHVKKDWPAMHEHAKRTAGLARLLAYGPVPTSLANTNDPVIADEMRAQVRGVEYMSKEVLRAIQEHDEKKLDTAIRDFRKVFEPVREAAKKLKR